MYGYDSLHYDDDIAGGPELPYAGLTRVCRQVRQEYLPSMSSTFNLFTELQLNTSLVLLHKRNLGFMSRHTGNQIDFKAELRYHEIPRLPISFLHGSTAVTLMVHIWAIDTHHKEFIDLLPILRAQLSTYHRPTRCCLCKCEHLDAQPFAGKRTDRGCSTTAFSMLFCVTLSRERSRLC